MRLILMVGLFVYGNVLGQYKGPHFPIKDEWFWNYGSKGLQEGDKMPDIPLGTVLNNKTGKKRFSDFKGKLLILDFWGSSCSSCIAKFPEMEELQKEFADQIQVFLINPWESEEQIKERMKYMVKDFKFPDLPNIVSDRSYANLKEYFKNPPLIGRYFPVIGVPYHVWIDKNGIIRLRGGPENTYAAKIRDFLSGKSIEFLKNNSTVPDLNNDKTARYYNQLGYLKNTPLHYGSFITGYNNEITGNSARLLHEVMDSTTGTRITSFMNRDLLDLYLACFYKQKSFLGSDSKLIFSPSAYTILDFIEFPKDIDTLKFTTHPGIIQRNLTTEEIIRSKYCYEQVVPLAVPEPERYEMMLEDLNRYFKVHYKITGSIENKKVKYYELVRTSNRDKIGTDSLKSVVKIVNNGSQTLLQFQNLLSELFPVLLRNEDTQRAGFIHGDDGQPLFILNGTGWPEKKRILLNISMNSFQSFSNLRRMLQAYDLDVVEKTGSFPFLVFRKVDLK